MNRNKKNLNPADYGWRRDDGETCFADWLNGELALSFTCLNVWVLSVAQDEDRRHYATWGEFGDLEDALNAAPTIRYKNTDSSRPRWRRAVENTRRKMRRGATGATGATA